MGILLAFAPFIVFAIVDRAAGALAGLIAGAIVALILLVRDWLVVGRSVKILDIGTAFLFAGLVLYSLLAKPTWSVIAVRLCVDTGLLLIVLVSMAVGRPFTVQYAREQVKPEFWNSSEFRRTNYLITGVWALAFAVMVATELILLYAPGLPPRIGIIVIILALVGAVKFTGWYPEHVRTRTTS
jgi:predicted membrane-bound dolichyl-phosphate-mannose-protein mannosyltransferase